MDSWVGVVAGQLDGELSYCRDNANEWRAERV